MGRLYRKLQRYHVKFITTVHDELVFEVPEDKANEISKIIKDEMEAAGREYLKSVPCIVEVVIGDTWQK